MREKGFTLIETLIVLALGAVIMSMGWPHLQRALVRSDVRGARIAVAATWDRARTAAATTSRSTMLLIDGARLVVVASPRLVPASGSTRDTLDGIVDLAAQYGVTVSTDQTVLGIDPRGLGGGTAATIGVSKGGVRDSVVISAFGRVLQ